MEPSRTGYLRYNISTIKEANNYLHKRFLPRFNKRFCYVAKDPEPAWRVVPKELNLDSIFCIKEQRTVRADNTISYKNRIFQILPDKYRIFFAKAEVVVEKRLDDSIYIKYKDQYLNYKEISCEEPCKTVSNHKAFTLDNLLRGDIFTFHQG